MRLFEVDLGSARDVLAVLQGLANKEGQSSELPFPVVMNILKPFDLPLGGPDSDRDKMLVALKNSIDPAGDVFDVKGDGSGTLVLNTKAGGQQDQTEPAGSSTPTVDKMAASGAKKLTPNI
jgi:hypothetical protein